MKKTIGGDRISSGRKMQVDLHPYERSTHNRSYLWRNTQSPGTVVPFMVQVGTPGSTFDIDLDIDVMTHPTLGPGFMSFDLNAHIFQVPIRLYHAWLHNNKLKIGLAIQSVKLPVYTLTTPIQEPSELPIDNTQINPSCILAYLGVRGIGWGGGEAVERDFNAIPLLGYWDIIKNYYTNKQEEVGAVIQGNNLAVIETITSITIGGDTLPEGVTTTPITPTYGQEIIIAYAVTAPDPEQIMIRIVGFGGDRIVPLSTLAGPFTDDPGVDLRAEWTYSNGAVSALYWNYETAADTPLQPPRVVTYPLAALDEQREQILQWPGPDPFVLNTFTELGPLENLFNPTINGRNPRLNTQEGLAVRTYKSDLLNNWLNEEWIDDINTASMVSTAGNIFSIDQLNMAQKMYKYLNRVGVSGGSYKDWMEATYTHINFQQTESPIYLGGLMKGLAFQEVVSNSEAPANANGAAQPLGTLAGKGVMTKKHKGGKIRAKLDEMCYLIGLFDITPNVDYSQGNNWDAYLTTLDDFHKPQFDQIGFQNLMTYQMAWWDSSWDTGTNEWINKSAGKQPAWLNYMTEINKCYGNFAIENSEMFMTLNRRYERLEGTIKDLTTYIDPVKYNFIFADTSIDAMNFWVNIAVNITYRGKMSGKIMPNV